VSLMAASGTWAQQPTDVIKLSPSPLALPPRIGPLIGNPTPHRYDDPRLGVSYAYNGAGATLTIYIYNAGVEDLADGPDTVPTCVEFETAKEGVMQAYQKPKLLSEHMVRLLPPADAPLMREAVYEFEREGHPMISYVWITGVGGNFLKLRFSAAAEMREEMPEARRAVLNAMGEALKPHLKPADPNAKKAGTSLVFDASSFSDSKDVGGAAFMYSIMLTSMANEHPELAPVCGGPLVPSYETELSLVRTVFLAADEPTKLSKKMQQIEAAGFLEEFVWVDRHRQSWGDTPPDGLTLADYQAWKKKNLKRFKVPGGAAVTIDHPRALPLEPL
jgi:hypothetical protein